MTPERTNLGPRVRISSSAPVCCREGVAGSPRLPQNIENNPMQSSRAVAGTDALSRYLTRRANQQHFFIIFIIAKSVEPAAGAQRRLFGVTSGETP
jgi:hypothetical protein